VIALSEIPNVTEILPRLGILSPIFGSNSSVGSVGVGV